MAWRAGDMDQEDFYVQTLAIAELTGIATAEPPFHINVTGELVVEGPRQMLEEGTSFAETAAVSSAAARKITL